MDIILDANKNNNNLTEDEEDTLVLEKQKLLNVPSTAKTLQYIYLEGNQIEELPADFFPNVPFLMWLDVRDNRIKQIPTTIENHNHIKTFLISNNQLMYLPLEISTCSSLTSLQLTGNPLMFPPASVLEKGTQAIKRYLADTMKERDFDQVSYDSNKDYNAHFFKLEEQEKKTVHSRKLLVQCPKLSKSRRVLTNSMKYVKPSRVGSKDELMRKVLDSHVKEMDLKKEKMYAEASEKILEKQKHAENLSSWRKKYRHMQMCTPNTYRVNPHDAPFGVDEDCFEMLSRMELFRDLPNKFRKKLQRKSARSFQPRLVINKAEIEYKMKKFSKEMEDLGHQSEGLLNTPRTKKQSIANEIEKFARLQNQISKLTLANASSVATVE